MWVCGYVGLGMWVSEYFCGYVGMGMWVCEYLGMRVYGYVSNLGKWVSG
jgi:hypothetical protein